MEDVWEECDSVAVQSSQYYHSKREQVQDQKEEEYEGFHNNPCFHTLEHGSSSKKEQLP